MAVAWSFGELDELAAGDPYIRNLLRTMRDGRGMSLEEAVAEMVLLADPEKVRAAAEVIRQVRKNLETARDPRAIVGKGIESWYAGPRREDPCWPALVELLRGDGWGDDALTTLDEASSKVVAYLPDPHATGQRLARGLVLGYVQSGKTTNFTAVIAKAADAGYRLFVVLSGIHDALRTQTQDRLNEQLWEPNPHVWNRLTNAQDFRPTDNVDALLTSPTQRTIVVVKKNGARLRALRNWLFEARPEHLERCPTLIIDDEADQASVNTARPGCNPKVINGLIRELVNGISRCAYVGYTATPFANVLIDPTDLEDLYPRDFIVDLPRPKVYIGPEAIFGREPLEFDPEGYGADDGHDLVRDVPPEEARKLVPGTGRAAPPFEPEVTQSLDSAIRYFLLSTAARRARRRGNRHATALIHTSQRVAAHQEVAAVIRAHVRSLAQELADRREATFRAFEEQWRAECQAVPASDFDLDEVRWEDVRAQLPGVAAAAEVIVDNSQSLKRLAFDDNDPRVYLAVGGNTLSRGLTLEGLSVSFFVRTASAYDTLLPMGRWFGYRNGYADLMRIWMTDEMTGWFHHLATVEQEIRHDIERYESEHITPADLGVRIRTHPKLAITAAAKMQAARTAQVGYSGRRIQTILFNTHDEGWLRRNLEATRRLLVEVAEAPRRVIRPGITVLGPVPSTRVIDFLGRYAFHENSRDLNGTLISRYIEERMGDGELTQFRVVVMGRGATDGYLGSVDLGPLGAVGCINRARLKRVGSGLYADIKSLMSQIDRAIDLDIPTAEFSALTQGEVANLRNPPGEGGSGDGSGLLLIYPVSKDSKPIRSAKTRLALDAVEHVIGVGLVFPRSRSTHAEVDYLTVDVSNLGVTVEEADDAVVDEDAAE